MARTLDRAISTPFMDSAANLNMAVNGGMEVSQENGATQITLTTAGGFKYIVDQWNCLYVNAAGTAVIKAQQVAPPGSPAFGAGFPNCLQMTATTLHPMAGASDYAFMCTFIEGYRVAKLGSGNAANPQFVTIGFWAYATIAGTMAVSLRNSAFNRTYITNVVVNNALTWEYKTVTIPVDSTGTWLMTNGAGLVLGFCFGSGATNQGTSNAWQAAGTFATSSTTNFFASNNNTVCITGVGVWPGTDAPTAARSPFAQPPLPQELQQCQRYWEKSYDYGTALATATAVGCVGGAATGSAASNIFTSVWFKVPKRITNPTISLWSSGGGVNQFSTGAGGSTDSNNSASAGSIGQRGFVFGNSTTSSAGVWGHFAADARL